MNLLVTGASGLIGAAVCSHAAGLGWRIVPVCRPRRGLEGGAAAASWDPAEGTIDLSRAGEVDVVIHLAGETLAQRWSAKAKSRIRDSRVEGTKLLIRALRQRPTPPRVFLCASATGYYGNRGDAWVDESDAPGTGFLADVCRDWEAAARGLADICRVVHLRFGIVLSRQGGALDKMRPIFRLGLGGRLGNGRQYWSWVTLRDAVRAIEHTLANEDLSGPINVTSPSPPTNAEFTRSLGRVLRRPTWLSVPAPVVRTVFGEMGSEVMLSGARVHPEKLLASGFLFEDAALDDALRREAV